MFFLFFFFFTIFFLLFSFFFFFFNDTATTEIYTLSLHDALPILKKIHKPEELWPWLDKLGDQQSFYLLEQLNRKSTRLNSSHVEISYAVFCLKKKKKKKKKK